MPIKNAAINPLLSRANAWFNQQKWKPFPFQKTCWKAYLQGESGLLNAPTGTGKTFALLLPIILEGLAEKEQNHLEQMPESQNNISINIRGASLVLHPYRAIYWKEMETLMIADLHLGKAVHFRKAGLPVPRDAGLANFDKLIALLLEFEPKRLLFLGDLFHSDYNPVWDEFGMLLARFHPLEIDLVVGNHDILNKQEYEQYGIRMLEEPYEWAPFLLSHHPMEIVPAPYYNLAGHIHPCVQLSGPAKQGMRLPCFSFGSDKGLLPAFGTLTGGARIKPDSGDRIFVIADERVIRL